MHLVTESHIHPMAKILKLYSQEEQLVSALRAGDSKAQRIVFEKYSGKMMSVCLRYVGDRVAAEDLLVQGFMKIFQSVEQFRGEGSFEGWMRRIMANESLTYLRKKARFFQITDIAEAASLADYSYAEQYLEAEEIMVMIGKLPPGYRMVFNLYAIDGYTHAEIAEMLGITESTSKSQLHRARAHLQKMVIAWQSGGTPSVDESSKF